MKVESVVTGVDRYSHPGDRQRNDYVFETGYDVLVPIGAKVTVEWDDNEHRCPEAERLGRFMRRSGNKWYAVANWNAGRLEFLLSDISVCPDCGKKLGD